MVMGGFWDRLSENYHTTQQNSRRRMDENLDVRSVVPPGESIERTYWVFLGNAVRRTSYRLDLTPTTMYFSPVRWDTLFDVSKVVLSVVGVPGSGLLVYAAKKAAMGPFLIPLHAVADVSRLDRFQGIRSAAAVQISLANGDMATFAFLEAPYVDIGLNTRRVTSGIRDDFLTHLSAQGS